MENYSKNSEISSVGSSNSEKAININLNVFPILWFYLVDEIKDKRGLQKFQCKFLVYIIRIEKTIDK